MRTAIYAAAVALVLAAAVAAEGVRSISEVPSRVGFARATSVGAGASAEAVDFTDISGFSSNHRNFAVSVKNEDTTAANVLLVSFVESGSVAASELTTPGTDGSEGTVVRLEGGETLNIDVQASGLIWQSGDSGNLVDARVVWSW